MFGNGRKTIGVFISQVNDEFQDLLSRGISTRAMELNYNVAFFTNFGGYFNKSYDAGEIKIADLPYYEDLDGIIIAADTMDVKGLEERICNHIKNRASCPVVSVRKEIKDFYNVLIDNKTVLRDIIEHFIHVHGFTRFNFLAGPAHHKDSVDRLECFKAVLKEHNIPIEEERIYYGDFWKREGYNAVDYWLSLPIERPQAIICANDYMAVTVCNALAERGISVPDEIAISGCDDFPDAVDYMPSISTVRIPMFEMGLRAVEKIYNHHNNISQNKYDYLKTTTVIRESCGCKPEHVEEYKEIKRHYYQMVDFLQRSINRTAYMSADLTGLTTQEDINDRIRYYAYENVGFKDFYMCLRPTWQTYSEQNENDLEQEEEMLLETGIKNRVDYNKIYFPKRDLIPRQFADDEPLIYFFALLHHRGHNFGYIAIRFENIQTYMATFQAWLINVSNALENIRLHSELNRLVYQLEDMYIRDELTGLYNRRGLVVLGQKYLKQAVEEQSRMMILTADMDKLKFINDNYGHSAGDIALKVVADALTQAADDDEICIRCGGDEFTVIGLEYDEKKMNRFIKRFVEALDRFNNSGTNQFNVYVSYGWNMFVPDEYTTIEDAMIVADSKMYQQKYEKESLRIKANLVR